MSGYFRGENPAIETTIKFVYYPLKVTIGSFGVVRIDGNNIFFNTFANAVDFLQDPASNGNAAATIVDGDLYRDMGKTIQIFVGQYRSENIQHVATLTKAQKISNEGQATEGITGIAFTNLTVPPAGNNYRTGYVVTWASNPISSVGQGIPLGVSRTGHQ